MKSYYKVGELVKVFPSTLHKDINCKHTPKKRISEFCVFGGTDCVRFDGSNIPHSIECIGKTVPTAAITITWKNKKQRQFVVDESDINDAIYDFASENGFEDEIHSYSDYKLGYFQINGKKCFSVSALSIG
jgi:hypothetical protein